MIIPPLILLFDIWSGSFFGSFDKDDGLVLSITREWGLLSWKAVVVGMIISWILGEAGVFGN